MKIKRVEHNAVEDEEIIRIKTQNSQLAADGSQNLTGTEAVIRAIFVVVSPSFSAIDWYMGTHTLYFIAPLIIYFALTALTMNCPIKALFSKYRYRNTNEIEL